MMFARLKWGRCTRPRHAINMARRFIYPPAAPPQTTHPLSLRPSSTATHWRSVYVFVECLFHQPPKPRSINALEPAEALQRRASESCVGCIYSLQYSRRVRHRSTVSGGGRMGGFTHFVCLRVCVVHVHDMRSGCMNFKANPAPPGKSTAGGKSKHISNAAHRKPLMMSTAHDDDDDDEMTTFFAQLIPKRVMKKQAHHPEYCAAYI